MGAHSSISIKESEARAIYRKLVGSDAKRSRQEIEAFFDRVLDERLYNMVLHADHWEPKENTFSAAVIEIWTEQYMASNPQERSSDPEDEVLLLRKLLAYRVAGAEKLYVDDGELQDNSEQPYIDFIRDSAEVIKSKLQERSRRMFEVEQRQFVYWDR